ncbi:MAG: hypothetical protein K0Q55_2483 [Verrucomicrobia bacterium]|nr:hypothetical protein [Verrucomicrobiota bacterium]
MVTMTGITHQTIMRRTQSIFTLALGLLLSGAAALRADQAALATQTFKPFAEQHCVECHDKDTMKGGLDLTALLAKPDFAKESALWTRIHDRIAEGEMPPAKKTRPPQEATKQATRSLAAALTEVDAQKQLADGRTAWRRLNRVEYQNTIRDLFHIDLEVKEMLPEDGTSSGFDTVDRALDISPVHIEKYLEAADAILDAAIVKTQRPQTRKVRYQYAEDKGELGRSIGGQVLKLDDGSLVFMNELYPPKLMREAAVREAGRYRFRLSAYAWKSGGKTTPILIYTGSQNPQAGKTELTQTFDAPPDKPKVFEWEERMQARDNIRVVTMGPMKPWPDKPESYQGVGLAAQWLEVEGPLVEEWPPKSHTTLLGNVNLAQGTLNDANAILRRLMPRAFRRSISETELAPYTALIKARLDSGVKFEDALRVGLKAVLTSPDFLYLKAKPGKLTDPQLASRLSYFLWSTMPDEALLTLANQGQLAKPDTLRAQVERMLKDPKAVAFTDNFTGQWLGLRNIKATNPDKELYPEFDELLERSMVIETKTFFNEILKNDLSVVNFIHSDFAMLNERLARHYEIPGVQGMEFRKVALKPEWRRGGVLTQASILKVSANGTTTSPVLRGVWLLDRLLGKPVPPPPKNVAAIEPDIRGAVSIRDQLNKHRNVETCASCHVKIDPPGYALECFDVIGGYRATYRKKADWNNRAFVDGKRMPYGNGPKVENADKLSDGRAFTGIDQFKALLLKDREQLARATTEKLLVYATGHGMEFKDRAIIEDIVKRTEPKLYGFRSLIHELVQSPTFQSK